ncbi:hypothetical protein E4U55_002110 [Claviceps digitariae]|nr:hypothetical protein E4U55_002110 [Claviceps digitariae]
MASSNGFNIAFSERNGREDSPRGIGRGHQQLLQQCLFATGGQLVGIVATPIHTAMTRRNVPHLRRTFATTLS